MHGICSLSCIPVRSEPNDPSEMVNQLLFGELAEILERQEPWLRIRSLHDGYIGWIDHKQLDPIDDKGLQRLQSANESYSLDLTHNLASERSHRPILIGSVLHDHDGITFNNGTQKTMFNGLAMSAETDPNEKLIEKIAKRYLGAPYLWGGRSPFGIDCSGFTQVVYRFFGQKLPRDAHQQANEGELIQLVAEARTGDLAFFSNEKGKIIHVGIVLADNKIIHAHGEVRIDPLDNYGIHNANLKRYSHNLNCIKRML